MVDPPTRDERESLSGGVTRVLSRDEGLESLTISDVPSRPIVEVGATLDRFEIRGSIGRGGMGEVFRAYDPKLGREVALKLLRRSADPTAEARLLREAQAMARLSHPNILPIFDVGRYERGLFIAMQLVEGQTLRKWLEQRPPWRQIVQAFMAAGQGLVAAHEVDLVHRDFKPSNVMRDERGGIHVMDFGLARAAGDVVEASGWSQTGLSSVGGATRDEALTRSDAVVGTPPYMAPEQHLTNAVDPRSDQYSFCVSLWEGIYGVRPFTAPRADLLWKVKQEHQPAAPRDHPSPRWLRDVMMVGLSPEPDDRHASMAALLAELSRGLHRSARRRKIVVLGGLLGAAAVVVGLVPAQSICDRARERLDGTWDRSTAAQVQAALRATEVPYAEDTWRSLQPVLDAHAQRWIDARVEACEATQIRHEQSEVQMDLRVRCLESRRRDLVALVDALRHADAETVHNATEAALALPPIETCEHPDAALASMPDDPQERRRAEALAEQLSEVRTALDLGRYDDAGQRLASMEPEARALAHEPVLVELALLRGLWEGKTGEYDAAAQTLTQAYFDAGRLGLDGIQARISVQLVYVTGSLLRDAPTAWRWAKHAEADVERVGDEQLRASMLANVGSIHRYQDELPEARAHYERALEIWERTLPPLHPSISRAQGNIAAVLLDEGKPAEALALHQKVVEAREGSLGPWHPLLGQAYNNLGTTLRNLGRNREALDAYHRALEIRERSLGADHPEVGSTYANLGVAHGASGNYKEAREWFQRALVVQEPVLGPAHPRMAGLYNNIANTDALLGHFETALESYARALAIWEERLGPDSPSVAQCLGNISTMERMLGRLDEAKASSLRALQIQRERLGPDHPLLSPILQNLGSILRMQGKLDEALATFEQGLAIATKVYGPHHEDVVIMLIDIGVIRREQGQLGRSQQSLSRAVEVAEQALPPDHPRLADAVLHLGVTQVEQEDTAAGIASLERAVAILEGRELTNLAALARARFALAQSLGRTGRGRALAKAAREGYGQAEGGREEEIAEIDAWLAGR